nr:T9SS type A sorting domain-containing protein [Bacteroidota bacterium]
MKTKTFLQTTSLAIFILLLSAFFSNAQIQLKGLAVDHEGIACWDADGTGPEPAATGHPRPFALGSTLYYSASRDYDDIDPDKDAAMCHFTGDIIDFPQFVQTLADNGFTAGQVKIKYSLSKLNEDIEGEDWFVLADTHYLNRYDAYYHIELNGEPMVSVYINHSFVRNESGIFVWYPKTNYSYPWDASGSSSPAVQDAAAAFLDDMDGQQLRMALDVQSTGIGFGDNGRLDGAFFELVSGYLEKGIPELPYVGLASEHQGLAVWDADGTGPEPEAYGHTFNYGGQTYHISYYIASRDYDGIDSDTNAALCHFKDGGTGFPNLEIQLAYRGFTMDQLKSRAGLATSGANDEGIDWGLDGSIHWYHYYGTSITIEIAGEPILEYLIDTNYSYIDLDIPNEGWWSIASYSPVNDISANASAEAQYVAISLLKDIGDQSIGSYMEGHYVGDFLGNGRDGVFQQIDEGYFTLGTGAGTFVGAGEVYGVWEKDKSPYMVDGDLMVPDGETLEIEAGVKVAFRGPCILVDGCVKAEGTAEENIVFTHSNPSVLWDGFDYYSTPASNDSSFFDYCIFEYGYAQRPAPYNSGGAIAIRNVDKLKITNCIFQYNLADQPGITYNPCGGAIALWNSDPLIQNCIFRYNYAEDMGGAIFSYEYASPIISGCLFHGNKSAGHAGAVGFYQNSGGILLNNTIADNSAEYGGALSIWYDSDPEIINTILWDNTAVSSGNQVYIEDETCSPGFYYCDIEEGAAGFGGAAFTGGYLFNMEEDPQFTTEPDEPVYLLMGNSPCIDMGTPDTSAWYYPQYLSNHCLCGNQRILGGCIDMGAYEVLAVGIEDIQPDFKDFTVLPNPFRTTVQMAFELVQPKNVTLEVYNSVGSKVAVLVDRFMQKGDQQLSWNVQQLAEGFYFCRLQVGNKVYTRKIVKMK